MRRDLCFYAEAPIEKVYNAYLTAATNKPFERECSKTPYHHISFGINFSFKYNMNGGGCNLHFMPSGTGTAINMRFTIAQAAGARYERYANDLNDAMQKVLPVALRPANYDVEEFLKPENQVTLARPASPAIPTVVGKPVPSFACDPAAEKVQVTPPAPAAQTPPAGRICRNCGYAIAPENRFCSHCGTPAPTEKICPNCNKKAADGDLFCGGCGTRLQ